MEISVIVPAYNEKENIEKLFFAIKNVIANQIKTSFEIIFIDDGSTDDSWQLIERLADENSEVKGFRFSKNFGHQYALKAGIDYALGDAVISIDADFQQPPELIVKMYKEWKNGNQIVYAIRKKTKGAGVLKKLSSALFYKIMNILSDVKLENGASDFRLLDRKVVDELKKMKEYYLFIRGLVKWIGYKTKSIEYIAEKRYSGKTKYSARKMFSFAQTGIMSFSIKPLRLATFFGFLISLFAFAYIVYALFAKFIFHNVLEGWTSILISVLLIGGIQLITIGIIGEYIGKLFLEVKKRPTYIISDKKE